MMLSAHIFFCLPLLLEHFTVLCSAFDMPEDFEMWAGHAKTCLMSYVNKKAQISYFVVRCLDSICILAISKVSRLKLASVAEQAGMNLTWSKFPEDTFSPDEAHLRFRFFITARKYR